MERLKGSDLARLQSQISGFSSSNHFRYISEALQTTRASNNPVEALELLRAMWDTAYAKTPAEKKSLNEVGAWLEKRLLGDPAVDAERIALELAWARRIARIAEARASAERGGERKEWHAERGRPDFGSHLPLILRRRAEHLHAQRHATSTLPTATLRLNDLLASFRGAQNARQVVDGILAIGQDSAYRDEVGQALRALLARDAAFWRDWVKKPTAVDCVAAMAQFGVAAAELEPKPEKPVDAGATQARVDQWESGEAWIARDAKNRSTLYFASGGERKPDERNTKDVAFEDYALEQRLRDASNTTPMPVEATRSGKKITKVRRVGGGAAPQ